MKLLVACEESQRVTKAFRRRGIEAYSCDLMECSGGFPQWHIQGDAIEQAYKVEYDMLIGFPPCTYMSKAGARWMYPKAGQLDPARYALGVKARNFFMELWNAPIKYIALENPTPLKVVGLPKHTQAIQPYQFGHPYSKRTLLWLKNLPSLTHTKIIDEYKPFLPSNTGGLARGRKGSRGVARTAKEASKTFEGVAEAMATQWCHHLGIGNDPTQ